MKPFHIRVYMRIDKARHKGCPVRIDHACTARDLASDGINVLPIDDHGTILKDSLSIENIRIDNGSRPRFPK
jgi:hypothetical protein